MKTSFLKRIPFLFLASTFMGGCSRDDKQNSGVEPQQVPSLNSCNATASDICGPFSEPLIALCEKYGGGTPCRTNRWNKAFFEDLKVQLGDDSSSTGAIVFSGNNSGGSSGQKIVDFYAQNTNYNKVHQNVMGWYGTTSNGCVAFVSTMLRLTGFQVPQNGMEDGESVSLVTLPLSKYLERRLSWQRISNAASLRPGDVVFTEESSQDPGYPAHTYVFHSWANQKLGTGWVIDNQGAKHRRNVVGCVEFGQTAFAYALRAP